MKQGERGYTLLEVMIFMAISGVLFVSAMVIMSGQQRKVQFNQGMRDINSKIQDYINTVANGYYLNASQYKCEGKPFSVTAGGNKDTTPGAAECIFVGKALQLAPNGQKSQVLVHTILGNAFRSSSDAFAPRISGIDDALLQPRSIAGTSPDTVNLSETFELPWGIEIDMDTSHTKTGMVVLASSFNGNTTGGAQQVLGVIFRDGLTTPGRLSPGAPPIDAYTQLSQQSNYQTAVSEFKAATSSERDAWGQICFRDASHTQIASINFTSDQDNGQLTTELKFDDLRCET